MAWALEQPPPLPSFAPSPGTSYVFILSSHWEWVPLMRPLEFWAGIHEKLLWPEWNPQSLFRIHVPRKGWNSGSLSCFSTTCHQPAALCSACFLGNNCWPFPAVGVAYLHLFILPPIRCWPEERLATPECAHKRSRTNFIPISYVAQTWVNQKSDPNLWNDESQNLKNRDCPYFGSFLEMPKQYSEGPDPTGDSQPSTLMAQW